MKKEMTKKQRDRVRIMEQKNWGRFGMATNGNVIMTRKVGKIVRAFECVEIDRLGTKVSSYIF